MSRGNWQPHTTQSLSMPVHECSARALLNSWNLITVESWNLTDKHAADVVCPRKPSRKGMRHQKKLESSLNDECGVEGVMHNTGLFLESSNLRPEDCAADVVRIRKPSHKSSRHSSELESSLHDTHGFKRLSDKALKVHAIATFHKTHMLVTTSCATPATNGNGHGNLDEGWLSDNASDMSTRPSSLTEALLRAISVVSSKDVN